MRREGWDLMSPEELTVACFDVVASTHGQTKPDRKLGAGGGVVWGRKYRNTGKEHLSGGVRKPALTSPSCSG